MKLRFSFSKSAFVASFLLVGNSLFAQVVQLIPPQESEVMTMF